MTGTRFKCANCGKFTTQPVQIRTDPESPLWCEKCAYDNIPAYRQFVDGMERPTATPVTPVAERME